MEKVRQREIKYLPLYYEWAKHGFMPNEGLCCSLPYNNLIDLFYPEEGECAWAYWGNGDALMIYNNPAWCYGFNPLRQNIVLFMAAMNGEL